MGRRIICRAVSRPFALACAGLALALAAGCGGEITVPKQQRAAHEGAQLFNERCSGCHSFAAANSYGSKPEGDIQPGERTNGPNFNIRRVKRNDVLFAIRNGGFSGAIMPANIVVGRDAELVADFVSRYSGRGGVKGKQTVPGMEDLP
jgi:mono/diheme cytochrome c family protein